MADKSAGTSTPKPPLDYHLRLALEDHTRMRLLGSVTDPVVAALLVLAARLDQARQSFDDNIHRAGEGV